MLESGDKLELCCWLGPCAGITGLLLADGSEEAG